MLGFQKKRALLPVYALLLCMSLIAQTTKSRFPAMDAVRGHVLAMMLIEPNTGSILEVNDSAVKLYGYPYEVLVRMNVSQINVLQDKDIKAEMQKALAEKRNYFNFPHRFVDGTIHMMEVYSSPVQGADNDSYLLSIIKEKEIESAAEREFAHYIERLNSELSQRIELYNEVRIRQWLIAALAALLFMFFGGALWLFVRYRKLATVAAANEHRYRNLLMSMQEAYAYHEIILDSDGKPVDYRFIEINTGFATMTGFPLESVPGKTVKELIPNIGSEWIERYGTVALTGEAFTTELYSPELKRWYQISAFSPEYKKFVTLFLDITKSKELLLALNSSIEDKDFLYRELLHRIKNTLTTIHSLISLQTLNGHASEECVMAARSIQNQIAAYSNLYAMMHESGTAQSVDLAKYVGAITEQLMFSFDNSGFVVSHVMDMESCSVNHKTASSLGLMINEVLTNVFKHAFAGFRSGRLSVSGRSSGNEYTICIADDGRGCSPDIYAKRQGNFGTMMIQQLAEQLHGSVTVTSAWEQNTFADIDQSRPGTCVIIHFPIEDI